MVGGRRGGDHLPGGDAPRSERAGSRARRPGRSRRSREHPLVKHYGLPLECLALTKAHRGVEGEHRAAAWRVMLDHVPESERGPVVDAMREALERWLAYRDDVAEACGLTR